MFSAPCADLQTVVRNLGHTYPLAPTDGGRRAHE